MLREHLGPDFPFGECDRLYAEHREDLLAQGIPLKSGALELLDFLAQRGLPAAVATSATRHAAELHLGRSGLRTRLPVVVTRDDVEHGKPHPDLFLQAAGSLGVPPGRCLAVEELVQRDTRGACGRHDGRDGAGSADADAGDPRTLRRDRCRPSRGPAPYFGSLNAACRRPSSRQGGHLHRVGHRAAQMEFQYSACGDHVRRYRQRRCPIGPSEQPNAQALRLVPTVDQNRVVHRNVAQSTGGLETYALDGDAQLPLVIPPWPIRGRRAGAGDNPNSVRAARQCEHVHAVFGADGPDCSATGQ